MEARARFVLVLESGGQGFTYKLIRLASVLLKRGPLLIAEYSCSISRSALHGSYGGVLLLLVKGLEVEVVLLYDVEHGSLLVVLHELVDLLHVAEVVTAREERVQLVVVAVRDEYLVESCFCRQLPAVLEMVVELPRAQASFRALHDY